MTNLRNPAYISRLIRAFVFYTALVFVFFAFGNGGDINEWIGQALLISVGSFAVIVIAINFAGSLLPSGRAYGAAREQMRLGNYFAAAQLFDKAAKLNPQRAEYYYERAVARTKLGDLAGALADYATTIDLTPIYLPLAPSVAYDAYVARATIYGQMLSDWHSAVREAGEAIAMYPAKPLAYITRADGYVKGNNLTAALADLNTAVQLAPNDPIVYNNRGYVHYLRGDLNAASIDLLHALELDSNLWQPYYHLAQVYATRGNAAQALDSLRHAASFSRQPLEQARRDAAFDRLHDDAQFAQLVAPRGN